LEVLRFAALCFVDDYLYDGIDKTIETRSDFLCSEDGRRALNAFQNEQQLIHHGLRGVFQLGCCVAIQ
jgi:hypothetical protein